MKNREGKNKMKRISVLRGPSTKSILGLFTKYEDAEKIAKSLFPKLGSMEIQTCLEEREIVDVFEDLLADGFLPYWVSVDVISGDAEIKGEVENLPTQEEVHYFQGKYAQVFVFAQSEVEAELRAQKLWAEYNEEKNIAALTIFEVTFDEHAEIKEVRRWRAVASADTKNSVNYPAGNIVSFRVVTSDIDEAIDTAREMYDEWLDKQIVGEE